MNAFTTMEPAGAIVRQPHRLIALSRILDAVKDAELERTIEMLIAIRDARDADPDVEELGLEDSFQVHHGNGCNGPGCNIADPDYSVDEMADGGGCGCGDRTWTEWHTRGRHKLGADGGENRVASGDPDEDVEAMGDERDAAWTEWAGRDSFDRWRGEELIGDRKATEDDELETDRCLAGDDMVRAGPVIHQRPSNRDPHGWNIGDATDAEPGFVPASMDRPVAANA